jgi:hypothetical protein
MAIIAPGFIFAWFLPNQKLKYVLSNFALMVTANMIYSDSQNLVEDQGMLGGEILTLEGQQMPKTPVLAPTTVVKS